jgi:hypothetical protein
MHRRAAGQWGRLFDPVARMRRIKGFVDGSQDAMPVKKRLFIKRLSKKHLRAVARNDSAIYLIALVKSRIIGDRFS